MCAHAVSVRLRRLEGVESVDISLNDGRADLRLRPDNTVSLAQVHEVVKQAGFTPRSARVRARADLRLLNERPFAHIVGTDESFAAEASEQAVQRELKTRAGSTVVLEGTIEAQEAAAEPRISVTRVEADRTER